MKHSLWNFLYIVLIFAFCVPNSYADVIKRKFTLVIDAGHGGHDPGAPGSYSKEKTINLNVALAFGRLVENNCPDVNVIYTRKKDVFVSLQRRADIANNAHADLFVSIHTNALPKGRYAYGSETYTLGMARAASNLDVAKRENSVITLEADYERKYKGFDPNKAESYVIFEIMQDHYMKQSVDLARCIQSQYRSVGRSDKGVHQAGFLVLRETSMPSVLTELGFITTPAEERYLNSSRGVAELSRSLYNGFLAYRRQHDKTAHALPENLPLKGDVVEQKDLNDSNKVREQVEEKHQASSSKSESSDEGKSKADIKNKKQTATVSKVAEPSIHEEKSEENKKTDAESRILYRVQVGAGKNLISTKDVQFKKLSITRIKEGPLYKYYYGSYTTYAEAKEALRIATAKIPGAYLVAYLDGERVTVAKARAEERKCK